MESGMGERGEETEGGGGKVKREEGGRERQGEERGRER